jgi:hypothetical protein
VRFDAPSIVGPFGPRNRKKRIAIVVLLLFELLLLARLFHDTDVANATESIRGDALVVLAGSPEDRIPKALELLKQGAASTLIINADSVTHVYGKTSADGAAEVAALQGELSSKIRVCGIQADSTVEEADATRSCLDSIHARNVILVTSELQSARALAIFQHQLPGYSIAVVPSHRDFPLRFQVEEVAKRAWWKAVDSWL